MNLRLPKIGIFLLLLAPALFAQEALSARQIEAALEDELYPLAEQQIWEALSTEHTPDDEAALTILLIRALAGQHKFNDAVILADESAALPRQDAFAYWRARALFESGGSNAVFETLSKIPADSIYAPAALRLKGRTELAAGDLKAAQQTFEAFRKKFPGDENAAQNLLDLAGIYLERRKAGSSIKALHELLERFPENVLADAARLELARELIAGGGKDERAEAAILLNTLGTAETAHPRLRTAAWVELAALEQRAGNSPAAAEALLKAETLTSEASLRVRQQAARANLLAEEGKIKEAFALFDEAIRSAPETSIAAEVLIQKAEALLKTRQYASAEKAFQAYLNVTTGSVAQARALTGKGWSLWEQKRYEESAADFENAAAKGSGPEDRVTALIKAGDARTADGQYEKAYENYRLVTEKYADHPLAALAMYQSGVVNLLAGQTGEAGRLFARTETDFPQSEFTLPAALQQAELLKNAQQWTPALEEYRRIAAQYTNSAAQAAALHRQGLIMYRLGQWNDALETFRTVSEKYPDSPEAPQALYMRGFCRYMQDDTEGALELCNTFIEKYPGSVWTPEVLFWLGEHYYNHGDYAKAQSTFLDIAARFPKHELADDALFWAGSALLRQDSFLDAFTAYSRLAKEFPDSPLMLKNRFAQGETLTELGEFPRAILAYEEVIKTAADDPLADRARGRLADCLFTLGTAEASRYQEAFNAYLALYKRPALPFALKLQALYKIARCEEKMGLKDKAFAHYMDAVYSVTGQIEPLSPDAVLWFTRAAFDAAAVQEQRKQWKEAVNIYKRIIQADVPAKSEAQKRIEKIERDHASAF
jgi:TolA-binding protein